MNQPVAHLARRDILRSAGGILALITGTSLLGGCGGEEGTTAPPITVVPADPIAGTAPPPPVANVATSWMNFALTMQYVGAQFYALASSGAALPAGLLGGVGVQGTTTGGRRVPFGDADLAQYAAEFAGDQAASLTEMRAHLGAAAAAQPAIDLSAQAFATVGRAAGLGSGFDPFSGDASFLLGALILEHSVGAAYRGMLTAGVARDAQDILTNAMGAAVYRDGLIRALLAAKADNDATLAQAIPSVFAALARLEASATVQDPQAIGQASSSINDGDGHSLALTRGASETLRLMHFNATGTGGGLLPAGANGVGSLLG